MYQITCDNQILYDIRSRDRIVTSPKLILEIGKNGSLSFRIPRTNPMRDKINLKKSIFKVFQIDVVNNKKIYHQLFRGSAYSTEEDLYLRGTVDVEGELAFFNDSIVRPYNWTGDVEPYFQKLINEHNTRVDDTRKFIARKCTVKDSNNNITRANENYPTTKEEMNNKLIDLLGGHFETEEIDEVIDGKRVEKIYIDYLADYDKYNKQSIFFQKNLIDFTKCITAQDVKTVIIPLGKKLENGDYTTIKSVNNNKDYVEDQSAISIFGRIEGTVNHENVTVPYTLLKRGIADLANSINTETTIEVTAADLHELNVNIEALRVGRMTRVISRPHKWDKYMLLSKLELNLDDIKSSKITLGATLKTYTEKQVEKQKKVNTITTDIKVINNTVESVSSELKTINTVITEIPTEYVKTETFNNFKTEINNKVGRVYRIKGSVASYNVLIKLTNVEIGDVYNCKDTGANYVFTEEGWDKFSENYDFSIYITNATANKTFATIENLNKLIERVDALENRNEGGTN